LKVHIQRLEVLWRVGGPSSLVPAQCQSDILGQVGPCPLAASLDLTRITDVGEYQRGQPRGPACGMFRDKEATPRVPKRVLVAGDVERRQEVGEFLQEQLEGPKAYVGFGQLRRASAADLVVVNHRSSVIGEVRIGEEGVVASRGPAVDHDER